MSSKFGRAGGAGRGSAMRGMKETGPPPLGRGMAALQPRMQTLGGAGGMRGSGMKERGGGGMGKGRLGGGGGGGRAVQPASQDERFQLQQFEEGEPRPFAMAIRLTPELLSDLKRAEAEGSACLMKFGTTPGGHVLKIGDEEFKFNSAREDGGLCDIFEEQRRGEDGNGILKEAGSVWRKLSVLRTLNASEKDRVKKRSVEAQQQQKSRKAIILDPTHSQNLTQNSPIAGDAMGRRPPIKTKVQPPRKKFKPTSPVRSPVPAPAPVPVQKPVVSTASAIASAKAAKAASVASPELPPSGRAASLPPPPPNGKPGAEEGTTPSMSSVQMDNTPSPATTTPDTAGPAKPGAVVSPSELRNCLITLLTENPKGMTLKAVEKALGDSMPHVKPEKKTIEKAIRAIASYHAPGKYILKEGMTFAKPSPNSGSSPENAAADSPPLVDSPALPDMNDGSTHEQMPGGSRRSESGLLGDKPGSLHSSAAGKAPSIVQKSSENAVSRAIRKASENYQKSQPQSQPDHIRPAPAPSAQKSESRVTKDDVEVEIDDVDESGEIGIIEGEGRPDLNGDTEVESRKGEDESVPDSPKEKAMPAHSGASESSSSSGSSDSDSESSDSGDSRSGTSDSDGSSSDSDDDNMDEDVEIVSDDEDGDAGHQKPKAIDKKKASHQSKDAKRAKLKPPEKLQTQESEEIDIGGDEGSGQPVVDPEERANVVVENLDIIDDEVDVVSVGDGDSPQEMGSVSPERQTAETKIDVAGTPADVEDNRDLSLKSAARGNNSSLSKEEPDKTGEVGSQKDGSLGKPTDAEKPKAGTLKGRINSMANNRMLAKNKSPSTSSRIAAKESPVHINNRLPARDSLAQTSSPPRPESGAKSLLSSPALKKDGTEDSPRRAKDSGAKRKINTEARKSFSMDGKTESEELVDKLVEAPMRPWPRPGKSAHPSQSFSADATPESGVRGSRDGEGSGLAGRETEAETLPSVSRPLRDGSWRHNPDGPGLLGKPGKNVEYLGRSQGRETEANVPSSRQVKNMRRGNNDPEGARRNEPMNDSDSWGKPARDLDGPRLGNDGEVMVNRLREGRKELTRSEGPKASSSGGFNRQNDKKGRESPDRESGEWRESTPGVEPMDMKGRDSLRNDQVRFRDVEAAAVSRPAPNKGQNRDLRKPSPAKAAGDFSKRPSPIKSGPDFRRPSPSTAAGDLRKPSPVKPVGDLRKPSPAKAAGDIRKPSPATSNAQKSSQIAQKELQKFDQGVARDSNRTGTGSGKPLSSSQGEDRLEGGPSRNGRAPNDTFERPMESRGVKRQLDEGSSEPPRVYKKPSIAPVAPSSSLNRGVSDSGSLRPTDKKQVSPDLGFKPQNSESGRGGSSEIPASLAGPSAKAPSGESRKQRPLGKGQKSSAKEGMEPPKGRDWKAKNGAGLLGPGGDRRKDNPQVDPGLSNGKHLKSSSSPEEVSGKEYFAKYEKDSPDLRGPIRSHEEAEAYRKEYQTKYPVYSRLFNDLDKNGGHFSLFKRELVQATSHSDKQQISTKVRREFHAIRKEFKRMQKTFDILHEELQTIKQHLKNFAGKAGQG
ncbi:hypothetical protein M758_7G041200 [Ceratodon purpureus]|nr:hypothetical protein M758_7G041200 [Ceratodon purpureus]